MPRKKKKLISLEVVETNSLWDYRNSRVLTNFICNEEDAEKTFQKMDRKELWKHEADYMKQVKSVLAPAGTRNASSIFFTDDVSVEEVKLPASMKTVPGYVYKVYDYSAEKVVTEYGSQKDIISYLSKKIKVKNVIALADGETRKVECSPKSLASVLGGLEETTSQVSFEPVGRSGCTGDIYIVSVFKNCIK